MAAPNFYLPVSGTADCLRVEYIKVTQNADQTVNAVLIESIGIVSTLLIRYYRFAFDDMSNASIAPIIIDNQNDSIFFINGKLPNARLQN